jgi:hypothetical protein
MENRIFGNRRVFRLRSAGLGLAIAAMSGAIGYVPDALAFSITKLAPGYSASNFATIDVNTNAIAFDSNWNLYVQDQSTTSGVPASTKPTFTIIELTASSGYINSLVVASFTRRDGNGLIGQSLTGLDFAADGILYASQANAGGDKGAITALNLATGTATPVRAFSTFRPTGIDASAMSNADAIRFSGRLSSNGRFGSIYSYDLATGNVSALIPGIVATGVAVDAMGNIFASTKQNNFTNGSGITYLGNSIYSFSAANDFASPLLVASFDSSVGELTFDSLGRLYAMQNNATTSPGTTDIFQLTLVSEPASLILMVLGIAGVAYSRRRAV